LDAVTSTTGARQKDVFQIAALSQEKLIYQVATLSDVLSADFNF
jgi:hypothetical protein